MSDEVVHRGPDGFGLVGLGGDDVVRSLESSAWRVALGHRRLSIIDLSPAAAQPMVYRERFWLNYNGEVCNYVELRSELQRLGHAFRTQSDSIEGRFPFLDHELIELCLSFAPELLYHRGWTKWPLRRGLEAQLPEQVARRRSKFGFWVPQDQWLCGPLRPALREWLTADRPLWELVDRASIRRLAEEVWRMSGRRDEPGQALVRCFMLDKWLEVFDVV